MKFMISIFITALLIVLSGACFAGTVQKFEGGIKDILMSPLQVSDNVQTETSNAKFLPFALVGGLLKGSFYMAKKIVTGTLVVVTSPLDMLPRKMERIDVKK